MDRNAALAVIEAWFTVTSLSARRAWIEIAQDWRVPGRPLVALRKESVDRNALGVLAIQVLHVALRKESVDRNKPAGIIRVLSDVALRKESVDRNTLLLSFLLVAGVALRKESVDRNFIELLPWGGWGAVALRKESVDRNYIIKITGIAPRRSLSARRAWIEIHVRCFSPAGCWRRSPQGERG